MDSVTMHGTRPGATRQGALALGAVAGPVVLTLAWIVLGLLRPGFSPISQPISGLGVGQNAAAMNAAFVVSGLLLLAGVVGVFRAAGPGGSLVLRWSAAVLLGLACLGCVMDGLFTLVSGFRLHMLGFLLACGCPVLGFAVAGMFFRGVPGWRRFGTWLLAGSPLTFALMWLFLRTFDPVTTGAGQGVSGLIERALILEVHGWFVTMGWLAYRRSNAGPMRVAATA